MIYLYCFTDEVDLCKKENSMSKVQSCPTCGGASKIKEVDGMTQFESLQNRELEQKIVQLKKAMMKYKEKSETLEEEVKQLKANQ